MRAGPLIGDIKLQALPSSINNSINKFLPLNISDTMTTVNHSLGQSPSFAPWTGFGLLCGYAIAALAVGGWLMVRRDA